MRRTRDLEEYINNLLVFMSLSHKRSGPVGPMVFDGAELMDAGFYASIAAFNAHDGVLVPATIPSPLIRKLDVAVINTCTDGAQSGVVGVATRTTQLSLREARGLPRAQKYVRERIAVFYGDGTYESADKRSGKRSGEWHRFEAVGPVPIKDIEPGAEPNARLDITHGLQWALERNWRVLLGMEGSPAVGFMTGAAGAQEIFKLRDVPEGKARRAALRNWVSEHWRRDSHDPELERKVRRHLRGAESFGWQGFRCRVVTPPEALREEAWAMAERERERRDGLDVRYRTPQDPEA